MNGHKKITWTLIKYMAVLWLAGVWFFGLPDDVRADEVSSNSAGAEAVEDSGDEAESSSEFIVDASGNIPAQEKVRILLVGNSLTRNRSHKYGKSVQSHLKRLIAASGKTAIVETVAFNGSSLRNYAGMRKKKAKHAQKFQEKLRSQNWDYVILQERTNFYFEKHETVSIPAMKKIVKQIKKQSPDAEIMLYIPRGYDYSSKSGLDKLDAIAMECYMGAAGARMEQQFQMDVIPVNMHFYRCNLLYPEIKMIGADKKHPTRAGYFLAASCIYQKIFQEEPTLNAEVLEQAELTKEEALSLVQLWAEGISTDKVKVTLKKNRTYTMKVKAADGDQTPEVRFLSVDEKVATVNDVTGEITAVGSGMTVIAAETMDGFQAFCTVYVPYERPAQPKAEISGRQRAGQNKVSIRLTWKKQENVTTYNVYRAKSANGPYKLVKKVRQNRYTDKNAGTGNTWYYKIEAVNGYSACDSRKSEAVSVSTVAVKNVTVTRLRSKRISVQWSKAKKAGGYIIYRAAKENGTYRKIAAVSARKTSYVDKNVKKDKTYYYKVVAYGKN